MLRPAAFAPRVTSWLVVAGMAALAVITLASPGATRMHAWPWSLVHGLALAVPVAILLLRTSGIGPKLQLPRRGPLVFTLGFAAVVFISALASPYRIPSMWWAAPWFSGLALFLVVFDWIHRDEVQAAARQAIVLRLAGFFLAAVAVVSLANWFADAPSLGLAGLFNARNPYPLGHSNYTAGLAILMLPLFWSLAQRSSGAGRAAWTGAVVLALGLLFTSGSRGGFVGLAGVGLATLVTAHTSWRKTLALAGLAGLAALLLALAHPRTRAMFAPADPDTVPNASNVQRTAMFQAGVRLGLDRPLTGWGPGTTPLAFPRHRAGLNSRVENVLQLHCLPLQLWAELGAGGLAAWLLALGAAVATVARVRAAGIALCGYLAFSLTDAQLDVPVFAFLLAALAAVQAAPPVAADLPRPWAFSTVLRLSVVGFVAFARPDPTPPMNTEALALAVDPAQQPAATTMLEMSLSLNPDQEIVHFNLGWLQLVNQPSLAEQHFLAAARFAPDKGGVYFGLGLARLNHGDREAAARAFGIECVNDPSFLESPWWKTPGVGATRPAALAYAEKTLRALTANPSSPWVAAEAAYLVELIPWLEHPVIPVPPRLIEAAHSAERRAYFQQLTHPPDFAAAPIRLYRRERSGYPVLMRNLDLPVPVDLFDVQENALATGALRFLFPAKGWLGDIPLQTVLP